MKSKLPIIFAILILVAVVVTAVIRQGNQDTHSIAHDGVIKAQKTYKLMSDSKGKSYTPKSPTPYSFSITDESGSIIKDFAITHTRPMHIIVVRKDLANFAHLHPDLATSTGIFFFTNLSFPTSGDYRIFADFAVNRDGQATIFEDLKVGNGYETQALGADENNSIKNFNGYQVSLSSNGPLTTGRESELSFKIYKNGKAVTNLEPYLGALGHSVIIGEGDLSFTHVHPMMTKDHTGHTEAQSLAEEVSIQDGTVAFVANFPKPGKYKAFTQFQHEGKIFTTDFVISVKAGNNTKDDKVLGIFNTDHTSAHK